MNSLRRRLLGMWVLSLLASLAVGTLLVQLAAQSSAAQTDRGAAIVAQACGLIRDRYAFYAAGWTGQNADRRLRTDLTAVVASALARQDGIEGGVWQAGAGSLAYAYPTYEGSGPKTDLPAAERDQIQAVNQLAARDEQPVARRAVARAQTLLLQACPLGGPVPGLTAWTMTRVHVNEGFRLLRAGLAVLFGLMLAMALWLGRTLLVWTRHVRGIEAALAAAGPAGMPAIAKTGEGELDRIIAALNDAGQRLAHAARHADELATRVARAEKLASLGRVAAGVAHEIRNPIAAARLQGENGLAGDDARRQQAIGDMLGQIDRLDALVSELLAMTQRATPRPVQIGLAPFLAAIAERHQASAAAKSITLSASEPSGDGCFDPDMVGRVLDNLLGNAIRHTPAGGWVALAAETSPGRLTLTVSDSGSGVAPDLADRVFDPFVTSRPDGTGLGLAIARELADAHGGRLELRRPGGGGQGAVFALELMQGATWPQS